jgi:hypothetical protein
VKGIQRALQLADPASAVSMVAGRVTLKGAPKPVFVAATSDRAAR